MEGLHTVTQLLLRNDYITKIDISDFYHHFLLRQQDSKSMRFMWEGVKSVSYTHLTLPTKRIV